jgi:hypothetical protein
MPPSRKPRASKPSDPIALRIREAEKRLSPVRSDRIGYDEATYAKLADLVESGRIGKRFEVLREALRTGMDVLHGELSLAEGQPLPIRGQLPQSPYLVPDAQNPLLLAARDFVPAPRHPDEQELPLTLGDDGDIPEPPAPPGFVYKKGVGYVPGVANDDEDDDDA